MVNGKIGMVETVEAVRNHPHYSTPLGESDGKLRGSRRGLRLLAQQRRPVERGRGRHAGRQGDSLNEGSVDIGGSRPAVAQQLAEVLGIPVTDVNPQVMDTDSIGYTSNTGGSGVAYKTGWAAYEAAQDIKRQLIERAALLWETDSENVEYDDAVLRHKSDPELSVTFRETRAQSQRYRRPCRRGAAASTQ